MQRVIIGTAGHIDHGKTALVKALTGIDTDRLKEEKERGITIDLGFANLTLPSGTLAAFVDVPGHERFIRNMVAGATGIDLVVLVVAADEGIMPQTKEHLEICELLGIKDGIVVITKKDLVEEEWLELIKQEVKEFLKGTFLEKAPILSFSALTLEGKEELIKALDEKATQIPMKPSSFPFRLPIDGVFTIKGFGTVVRGTAISGRVTLNQILEVYPKGIRCKVRNIQVHGKNVEEALAGMRTALNLQGVEKELLERGDVLAEPGVLKPSQWIDVKIQVLKDIKLPLKNFENFLFYVGTTEVLGKMILFGKEKLDAGEVDVAQLFLQNPVVVWRGDRFILRRPSDNTTVAGGKILNPISFRRKRTKPWERKEVELWSSLNQEELLKYLLERRGFLGYSEDELQLMLSTFREDFYNLISKLKEEIISLREGEKVIYFSRKAQEKLREEIINKLKKYHEANPLGLGLTKELLKTRISSPLSEIFYHFTIEELIKEGFLIKEKELLALKDFKRIDSEEVLRLKRALEKKFLEEGFCPREPEEILLDFKDNYQVVKEILPSLLREGTLVKVSEKLIYHHFILKEVENRVRNFFNNNKELTLADFRNLLENKVSRKYLIPLLEYLDKQKITLRIGDKRVLRKSF
ncbi:MAG: selenocysteine-specific translation elongation factor [Thermodesulfobacteriaceae bacterium]|nr:selenocysteine-specific translation elongation factor [Thermodesulfobacteriaceae bacterium]MCX8041987.1 selenocysteine-specific translation elongation factor [Thermodesulfobacteriaceae bacterium]MDW8136398.1 selenocysteine-specific translation elongation factor [Thermodesulfobacterium sp.]